MDGKHALARLTTAALVHIEAEQQVAPLELQALLHIWLNKGTIKRKKVENMGTHFESNFE